MKFETVDKEGTLTRVGDVVIWATFERSRGRMGRGVLTKVHGSGRVTVVDTSHNNHVISSRGFIKIPNVTYSIITDPDCPPNKLYKWITPDETSFKTLAPIMENICETTNSGQSLLQ